MTVNPKREPCEKKRPEEENGMKNLTDRKVANLMFITLLLILGAVGVLLSLCAFVYILIGKLSVAGAMFPYAAICILGAIASGQAVKK